MPARSQTAMFLACALCMLAAVPSSGEESLQLNVPVLHDRPDLPSVLDDADRIFDQAANECEAIANHASAGIRTQNSRTWQLLPDGLLWHSYLAAPHEPRISTVIFHNADDEVFWDATLGGRVGLLRYGTAEANHANGWQWDLEGAVITRLDLLHAEDVESMDYRFGTEITAAEGPWALKYGYFHVSSHVGDEYLIRNPTFQRVNYVTESWLVGMSYNPTYAVRFYGEMANAFRASGGAKRYQFQTGIEYAPIAKTSGGVPFAAVNFDFRQAVDYDPTTTAQIGWLLQGPSSGRRLRLGLQAASGPTSQFSFFQRRQDNLGIGIWFDF